MECDFDNIVGRRNTGSLKWDKYAGRDIIPMWVADMDFRCPPAVRDALRHRVDHGVFGYSVAQKELVQVVAERMATRYGWSIDPSWIVWLPGLVPGINIACRCMGGDGDEAVCFVPAYPPFLTVPECNGRSLITAPLSRRDGQYYMDAERFKAALTPRTKLFILCHPHNPVGREFTPDELRPIVEICLERKILICSDEIHCDLVLDDIDHVPTATLSDEIAQNTITLMAPSKTFNTPGLNCGLAIIPNNKLRKKYALDANRMLPDCNVLGYVAAQAAYQDAEPWRRELIKYLRRNRDIVFDYVNHRIPLLSMDHVEATYLAWVKTSELKVPHAAEFFEQAGVGLSDGKYFMGEGFVRLNFGCSRQTLVEALERMKRAVEKFLQE